MRAAADVYRIVQGSVSHQIQVEPVDRYLLLSGPLCGYATLTLFTCLFLK